MSEGCNHNCSSCSENCDSRKPESFLEPLNPQSSVKRVIGVVSGKGGVGKSLVTSLMAAKMRARGKGVGILDADITGPSIPKAFGLHGTVGVTADQLMLPMESATGVKVLSANLILENETDPVIWRGPIVGGVIKQFWGEALWKDVDYMFVDMPPGTGDVPLTVFQSLPLDGIIIVTSPQDLVSMIVAKAVNMAKKMDIPILGLVENMSYLECPDCGKKISVFGESHLEETAKLYGIPVLAQIPIDPKIAESVDQGVVEYVESPWLDHAADVLEAL
ncbi:MAG: P-loop NTPase [Otoolea sp.]|nr:Mrp/NBP35 family ATP-binding protein [Clostridiaceae bacterium]MDD6074770.1 Mrp/NBP35 family ATP-binding protein [Clostridium sp.]